MLTGQRREEIAGMRRSEIDSDRDDLEVAGRARQERRAAPGPGRTWARTILAGMPRMVGSIRYYNDRPDSISGFSRAKTRLDAVVTTPERSTPIAPWVIHDLQAHHGNSNGQARCGVADGGEDPQPYSAARGVAGIDQWHDFTTRSAGPWNPGPRIC